MNTLVTSRPARPRSSSFAYADNIELVKRIQAGDEQAKDQLVRHNFGLVESMARYYQRYKNTQISLDDLIQEGCLGLLHAAEKFDPAQGYQFSTYAVWWIRQGLGRAYNALRPISLPVYQVEQLLKLNMAQQQLEAELGRPCTRAELSTSTHLSTQTILELRRAQRLLSLEQPVAGRTENTSLGEQLEDEETNVETTAIEHIDIPALLTQVFLVLTPREQKVLKMRYGVAPYFEMTLEEVSHQFHVTRERIRQIEIGAMKKLQKAAQELHHEEWV